MKNLPIFFDTETGGLESKGNRASSVLSLSTSRGNEIREIFAKPAEGSWLSEFSKQNILPQVSKASQTFTERQAIESFISTLRQSPGSPLVGYNSAGFDLNFLQNRANVYGLDKELQQVLAGRRSIDIGLRLKMLTATSIEEHIQKGTFTQALGGKTWGQATLAWGRGGPLADEAPLEFKALSQMKAYANAIEGAPQLAGDRMARGWKQEQLFSLLYPGDDLVMSAHQSTADVLMTKRLFEALPSGSIQTKMATEEFAHGWLKTTVEGYNRTIPKDAGEVFHSSLIANTRSKIPGLGARSKAFITGAAILAGTLGVAALITQSYFKEESIYDKIRTSGKEGKLNALAEEKFSFVKKSLREHGEKVGTGHDRIFFDKSLLSEEELTERLGFIPVSIAIPEAGQSSWTSFRHEENNFHIHEHEEKWVIHEDAHAASTMLAKKKSREEGFLAGVVESFKGLPHIVEEGIPGAYYYLKGKLFQSEDMLERLEADVSEKYKKQQEYIKRRFSNRFSGKDDSYNTIEGLGHKGVAPQLRKENTDFGSGYQGSENSDKQMTTGQKAAMVALGLGMASYGGYGLIKAFNKSKKTFKEFLSTIDKEEDAAEYLFEGVSGALTAFGGSSESTFSGKDDKYNTIEGLSHKGVASQLRKENTDFGSGYQGDRNQEPPENNFSTSINVFGATLGASYGAYKLAFPWSEKDINKYERLKKMRAVGTNHGFKMFSPSITDTERFSKKDKVLHKLLWSDLDPVSGLNNLTGFKGVLYVQSGEYLDRNKPTSPLIANWGNWDIGVDKASTWEHLQQQGKSDLHVPTILGRDFYKADKTGITPEGQAFIEDAGGLKNIVVKRRNAARGAGVWLSAADLPSEISESLFRDPNDFLLQKKLDLAQEFRVTTVGDMPVHSAFRYGSKNVRELGEKLGFESVASQNLSYKAGRVSPFEVLEPILNPKLKTSLEEFATRASQAMPYEIGALDIGLTKSGEFKIIEAQRQFGNISNPLVSKRVLNAVTGGSGIFGKAIATGFVASALTYGLFSGKDDNYNTIEGLGHKGIAPHLRKENTDFGSGVDIAKATRRAERLYKSTIRGLLKEKGHSGKINWTSSTDAGDLTLVAKSESGEMLFGIDRQFSNNQVDLTSIEIGEGLRGSGIGSSFYDIESRILKRVGLSGSVVKSPVTNPITGRMQANLYDSRLAYNYEDTARTKLGTSPDQFHSKLMNKEFSKSDWKDFGGGTFSGKIRPPQNRAMFSGRDDAHNTVEGLQHGGWAQRMRKLLTPFGSGWNAKKEVALRAFKVLKVGVKEQLIEMSHFLKKEYLPGLKKFQSAELALTAFTAYEGYSAAEKIYDGEFGVTDALALGAGFAGSKYAYMGWKKKDKINKAFKLVKNDPELAKDLASEAFGVAKKTVGDYVIHNKDSAFKTFVESGGGKAGRAAVQERFENTDFIEEFMNHRGDLVSSINKRQDLIKRVIDYDVKHKVIPQRNVAFSVMEGMGHTGSAPVERHKFTPFGSKWNALKNLAKGTETLEDIIKSPEFRESLSSAVKGKKLGAGSFGEAFKMTTKFRGQEFSFVRKTGFIGKDEISTMKRFQDDFAPTVYSSGTDKFAKEYIDMELFEGTTLGRATNPEQYVGRAKEALAKMHEQGYSHLDPHKSNIFVTNEGNVGLIDFGTSGKLGESARIETAMNSIYMEGRHGARTKQMDFDVLDKSMNDPGSFGKSAPPSAKTLDEGRRKKRIQQKKIERSQMNLSASKQMSINARNGGKKSNM